MSVHTSRTIKRFLCWSLIGNAAVRPDARPALQLRWRAAPKPRLSTTHSNAIARFSTHNQKIRAH
jgi:hypothetical protein